MGITSTNVSILRPVKRNFFHFFFLSLNLSYDRFENISVSLFAPCQLIGPPKKLLLGIKI
jgi:hypothetical protein